MGRTVVITSGGTNEQIDEVRKITNMSSGELGYRICHQLIKNELHSIDRVYYICPKNAKQPRRMDKVDVIHANDTAAVKKEVENLLLNKKIDYFIHSMAISDYTTDYVSNAQNLADEIASKVYTLFDDITRKELKEIVEDTIRNHSRVIDRSSKISSSEDNLLIKLKPTPKIISRIKEIQPSTYLVGFKLLNGVSKEELQRVAFTLLQKNNCDLVVANDLADIRKGKHKAMFVKPDNSIEYCDDKDQIAEGLVKQMFPEKADYDVLNKKPSNLEDIVLKIIKQHHELSKREIKDILNGMDDDKIKYSYEELCEALCNLVARNMIKENINGNYKGYSLTSVGTENF